MRKSQEKAAKEIRRKSADILKKQGLGYAKLPDSEEAALLRAGEKVVKKKHEIYDNTYYLSHQKSRVIGCSFILFNSQ